MLRRNLRSKAEAPPQLSRRKKTGLIDPKCAGLSTRLTLPDQTYRCSSCPSFLVKSVHLSNTDATLVLQAGKIHSVSSIKDFTLRSKFAKKVDHLIFLLCRH